jgi:hypothetical protein
MIDLDKDKQYIIVGVSKCGTTSTAKFLSSQGYHIEKRDGWFWQHAYVNDFGKSRETKDKIPIVILRDPVERAWSHYHYMFQNKPVEDTDEKIKNKRLEEVSRLSYYDKWLKQWIDKGAIVMTYEGLLEMEGFPHENKTKVKPILDDKTRLIIEKYIEEESIRVV